MSHYVCVGDCQGVSDDPKATCQAEDCKNVGQPLTPCDCEDGKHANLKASDADSEERSSEAPL